MFVAVTSLFSVTSISVLRPIQPPVYWITKDISLGIKVSEMWNPFSVRSRGNVERMNLPSLVLYPFVILGLDTGEVVSVCIDNSTTSSSRLKWRRFSFYHLIINSKIAEFHVADQSISLVLIISIKSIVLYYFPNPSCEFIYQQFTPLQWHSPHNL
jgi:hypothetical protein